MDALDLFFKKFSYKFPKGYPDINNEQDRILLENILENLGISVKLEETALTPSELSKDATLAGGTKIPRIEILSKKIQNDEELELNSGEKIIVSNKEEVLSQLKGKTQLAKPITLIDQNGNKFTTSNLKKTSEFGGGGGMRGGSELTEKAESAQCIVNAIRYSYSGNITEEDITDESIQDSKSDVRVTNFDSAANLLKENPSWLTSSVSIANTLASQYAGPFIQNRGSEWVKNLEKSVKPLLKQSGINDLNKWNPADIWMVSPDEMSIEWPSTLGEINALLLKKYQEGKIIGVSLKKAGKDVTLKTFNAPDSVKKEFKVSGIDVKPSHAKSYVLLDDGSKIEFRNFSGLGGFQGEIIGKKAAGGKVGYSIIRKAFADNGINLSSPNEIKDEVVNEDPNFKSKFEKLWKSIPELASEDFEKYYDDPKKTLNQNFSYRVSKFLALEIIDALNKIDNPSKVISDLMGYASSQTGDSSIFVKAF